jgi:hypothetical protein
LTQFYVFQVLATAGARLLSGRHSLIENHKGAFPGEMEALTLALLVTLACVISEESRSKNQAGPTRKKFVFIPSALHSKIFFLKSKAISKAKILKSRTYDTQLS